MTAVLTAKQISKTYEDGKATTQVLSKVDLTIQAGESVAIVGASGSGKSTLLHLLGGLDTPSTGEVWLLEHKLSHLKEAQRGNLRNQHMGFIYQFHHLLPEFSALENVMMPLLIRHMNKVDSQAKAKKILDQVGLSHRSHHRPGELSGGERQRVAIARALVTEPNIILADEPTGNLDYQNALSVFQLLTDLQQQKKTALLMVTHDRELAKQADRQMALQDGAWLSLD